MQSVFRVIPNMFDGVEVRTLRRTLEFLHTKTFKTMDLMDLAFWHRSRVMLKQ